MSTIPGTIKIHRGPEASMPTLAEGEPYFTLDTFELWIGDGAINHQIVGSGGGGADCSCITSLPIDVPWQGDFLVGLSYEVPGTGSGTGTGTSGFDDPVLFSRESLFNGEFWYPPGSGIVGLDYILAEDGGGGSSIKHTFNRHHPSGLPVTEYNIGGFHWYSHLSSVDVEMAHMIVNGDPGSPATSTMIFRARDSTGLNTGFTLDGSLGVVQYVGTLEALEGLSVLQGAEVSSGLTLLSGDLTLAGYVANRLLMTNATSIVQELALTSTQIVIGNASGVPTATTLSGDVTVDASGVTAIGANKVTNTMLADGAVNLATADVTGTLPVANGGTGLATVTSNNLLTGNGTSAVNLIAPGTNGQVLASNGTVWAAANPITASNITAALASAYDITTNDTWENTGLLVSLPSAGTYLLLANVSGTVNISAGASGELRIRLYNVSDASEVTNARRRLTYSETTGKNEIAVSSIEVVVTIAAAKTIRLEAFRTGGTPTFSIARITTGGTTGQTTLTFVKLSS